MKTYLRYVLCFLVFGLAIPNASYAISPVVSPNSMEETITDMDIVDSEITAGTTIKEIAKKPKRKKKGKGGGGSKMWLWGLIAGVVGLLFVVLAVIRAASVTTQYDNGELTEDEYTSKLVLSGIYWILGILFFLTSGVLLTIWLIQLLMNS